MQHVESPTLFVSICCSVLQYLEPPTSNDWIYSMQPQNIYDSTQMFMTLLHYIYTTTFNHSLLCVYDRECVCVRVCVCVNDDIWVATTQCVSENSVSKSKNSHYSNSVPENIHYSNSVSETVTIQILCHGKVCQRIACQRIATTQIVCHRAGKMKVLTSVWKQTWICTWYLFICTEHLCLYRATWHRTNSNLI